MSPTPLLEGFAVTRNRHLRSQDDLLIEAVQEVAAALGPIVAELAEARARMIAADVVRTQDLVPRASQEGQPTAAETMRRVLAVLEAHAIGQRATAVGAYNLARRTCVSMGVFGSERVPSLKRTRAEEEESPNPRRVREGTRGAMAGAARFRS